ncbi:MAG TPA: hypothetical protein VKU02_20875 [Gemmataceae bacterium]|nr:hypothetical protein [Gemmataceae bacterium]
MSQILKLPDEVYEALRETARGSGMAPEEWIAAHLPRLEAPNGGMPSSTEIARANARLRRHIISSGRPGPCDNERIDADLAQEYGDDHAKLYGHEKH